MNLESVRMRHDAFVEGLKARGLDYSLIEKGTTGLREARWPCGSLLKLPQRPTAVCHFERSDRDRGPGHGARCGIESSGRHLADRVDDISFAHLTQPPLTTVMLSRVQLAVTAFAALEALMRKEDGTHADYTIPTHLVMRRSTRAI